MFRPASSSQSTYSSDFALTAATSSSMAQTQHPPSLPSSSFFVPHYRHNLPPLGLESSDQSSNSLPPLLPPSRTDDFRRLPPLPKYPSRNRSASTSILPIAALSFTFKSLYPHNAPTPNNRLLSSETHARSPSEVAHPSQSNHPTLSPSSGELRPWPSTGQPGRSQLPENLRKARADSVFRSATESCWKNRGSPAQYAESLTPSHESTFSCSESYRSPKTVTFAPHVEPDLRCSAQPTHSGPENTLSISKNQNLEYKLRIRQQPIAARACGFGERDRRVIDPPPILELLVTDPKTGHSDLDELRYPLNVMHCTLWNAEGTNEETAVNQPDRTSTRRLMGQLVASPSVAKDEFDREGCFFCFPDLSCRTHGKYRLRFMLMRIDVGNLHVGGFSPILAETLSDVFTVYSAKDFPGMRPSSALTRALKLQGCNIQVKKGNERTLSRRRAASSDNDNAAAEQSASKGKRRRKQ